MPKCARSPPQASILCNMPSESDETSQQSPDKTGDTNVSRRKRKHACCSPKIDYSEFKEEIRDMLKGWKTEHDAILSKLATDITGLKIRLQEVKDTCAEVEKNITFVDRKYDEMVVKVQELEKERSNYLDHLKTLEQCVFDLQMGPRSSTIVLRNIPGQEKESPDDLKRILTKFGEVLQAQVKPSEVRDIYRAQGKPGSSKPIVAELKTVQTKNAILSAARNFNKNKTASEKLHLDHLGIIGSRTPVYVAEYLPPSKNKLFYEARQFANSNGYKFCWAKEGRIYLRKEAGDNQVLIKNTNTLNSLKSTAA